MNYNLINANSKDLKHLYDTSAFTFVGLMTDDKNIQLMLDSLKEYGLKDTPDIYVVEGSLMNSYYGLTKDPYPEDLHIVALPVDQFSDVGRLAIFKLRIGARWFDDIVDNNEYHEHQDEGSEE